MKTEEFDIFKIFYIIKKRWKLAFVIFILAASYLFYDFTFNTKRNFVGNFTVFSSVIEAKVLTDRINLFEKFIENKDFMSIAVNLDISFEDAKNIKIIKAKEAFDTQKRIVNVNIAGKDSTLLHSLPELLGNFITNDPYFKTMIDLYHQHLQYENLRLAYELDSSSNVYTVNNTIINNMRGVGDLLDRKFRSDENIANFTAFGVIGKPGIRGSRISYKFNITAAILGGIAAGVGIALLLEFLLFLNRRMKDYETKEV
jgi:capsular polysaccharide biosynthesis protein